MILTSSTNGNRNMKRLNSHCFNDSYFDQASILEWLLIPLAPLLSFLAWYNPSVFLTLPLGRLSTLAHYIGSTYPTVMFSINLLAATLHVFEGVYAYRLARSKGLNEIAAKKWCWQTFFLGVVSLMRLQRHEDGAFKLK